MSFHRKLFQTSSNLFILVISVVTTIFMLSCNNENKEDEIAFAKAKNTTLQSKGKNNTPRAVSEQFKEYWYAGTAEISSYKLEQARYGEMREGTAVLIYVTEDFLPEVQVKADRQAQDNVPVLKLNTTKNFNTGIYPYSIMTSTFYPVFQEQHAFKVSNSMQEWCGHVYAQLNNRAQFEIKSHSYFEGEADQSFTLEKAILENELWTQLRIDPAELPTGTLKIIPAFEYTRLKHIPIKQYTAIATLKDGAYSISYPELNRTLEIVFAKEFPHTIESWEERFESGYGSKAKTLVTKATRIKTIQSPYWSKNNNVDEPLRNTLGLK